MPTIAGQVLLVTGANGGIGAAFVHRALERGAARVYATARTPRDWDDHHVVPLALAGAIEDLHPEVLACEIKQREGARRKDSSWHKK